MTDKEMVESIMKNEYENLCDEGFKDSWQVYQSAWIKATSYADYIHTRKPPAIAQPTPATSAKPAQTYTGDDLAMAYKDGYAAGGVSMAQEGDAKDAAVQGEPISGYVKYCSISHPEAPHNFNRQASHAAHRYVCTCEGWEPWMEGATEADPMQKLIDTSQEGDAIHNLREAVYAVLSNEEHAFSGGMRSYQKGSQTWQVYEDLRIAAIASQKGEP